MLWSFVSRLPSRAGGAFAIHRTMTSSSSSSSSSSSLVAVLQLQCTSDKSGNLAQSQALLSRASQLGVRAAFLPEAFDFVGENAQQTSQLAEDGEDGETVREYRRLAKKYSMILSLGGFHQRTGTGEDDRLLNTHLLLGSDGHILATYSKAHLFDVDLPGQVRLQESKYVAPGPAPPPVVATSVGRVGLGVCYDLRFPELSLCLARRGAQILTYPSAFTVATGQAHWESLLRARAIETQCYVVAAAQTGRHNAKRSSFGHSLIVDPWGAVVAQCGRGEGLAVAQLDLEYLQRVRNEMPVDQHRRHDLYGLGALGEVRVIDDDDERVFPFGQFEIPARHSTVLESRHCFVSVNKKPVLPGHLLVVVKRPDAARYGQLTPDELADLSLAVQSAQKLTEVRHDCSASTITIQDGRDAGQTVGQVHVHVLPRRKGDFKRNDDIYQRIEQQEPAGARWRTEEEMEIEAKDLRNYWKSLVTK